AGADLWAKYMADHPNVKIEETVAATSDDARSAFNSSIQAGQAAYDIFAVDVDWMPSIQAIPDNFYDLTSYVGSNDWLDWKKTQGQSLDGSKLLGMGTDIGPEGVCYRADLLEAAGIPSDRDSVKEWLGGDSGTWADFFAAGDEYVEKSGGKHFFDSSAALMQGMVNQVEYSWVDADGNIIAADNAQMKTLYDQLTAAAATQSAGAGQWGDDWNAGMKSDAFAAMLCPAWIINNIRQNAGEDFVGWDIADQFPGGGGNWGGSFLVVPEASAVKEAAADLVAWITAPEQQAAVFAAASNFPSSPTAQEDSAVTGRTEPFLNDAPIGPIFTSRAAAVTVVPFKGAQYFDIQNAMANALNRVDVDKSQDPAASWTQFLSDVQAMS
ncbi:MAG: extracellular solute-binding protein, partial [Cellulomonadaceae bacterium]|nr:extracellular solute-binding protein [Cellulomonadaceae bacterium]